MPQRAMDGDVAISFMAGMPQRAMDGGVAISLLMVCHAVKSDCVVKPSYIPSLTKN